MSAGPGALDDRGKPSAKRGSHPAPRPTADTLLPRFVRAEANLLRLPLFALSTKGLRSLDGIECHGTITREGETYSFTLRSTRNTATMYPGPLARKAHLAFLSLATEQGLPIMNPISWEWRDLCRRMGNAGSGRDILQLKSAIESTAGLLIKSHYALWSKPEKRLIRNQEELLHLYDRVIFLGSALPDGSAADANYLWLADWYLDNLNALFTAPLDYELWRWLDTQSPIASRLYEYLLLNFYSGTPVLRINYEKLAQLLPVRPEKYRSKAKEKLSPALKLLVEVGVLESAEWAESRNSIAQLRLYRGKTLAAPRDRQPLPADFTEQEFADSIEVKEHRNPQPLEWVLVAEFYRLWTGSEDHRPTKKEVEQAKGIIDQYGPRKARDVVVRVVKRLRKQWPDAKTFGAIQKYLPDAARDYDREEQRREQEHQEQIRRRQEKTQRFREEAERLKFVAEWRPVWEGLTDDERDQISEVALAGSNRFLKAVPSLVERLCLAELARRQGAEVPAEVGA